MRRLFTVLILLLFFYGCNKNKVEEIIVAKPIKVSDNEIVNYIKYCNDRFNMCINYPSNFNPLPEPSNGDGRSFTNKPDGAEITVFGAISNEKDPLSYELETIKLDTNILKLTEFENGFAFYGVDVKEKVTRKGKVILRKKIEGKDTIKITHNLTFSYPTNKENKFKNYWNVISEDFK